MSSISFATSTGTAYLRGAERASMSGLVYDLTIGSLGASHSRELLSRAIPPEHYLHTIRPEIWAESFATALRVSDLTLTAGDLVADAFEMLLNTALTVGNDVVKLAARLHGQSEIHAWVDGPNRAWLADIIDQGRNTSLFRSDMGWEEVGDFLRASDAEPVVTSYSVTDTFPYPNPDAAPDWSTMTEAEREAAGDRADAWYALPAEEQWRQGMEWLRRSPAELEMKPDGWAGYRFGPGITTFDLLAKLGKLVPSAHYARWA